MILADSTTPTAVLDIIRSAGVIGLLTIILYGGWKKLWVFGWQYNELKDRHAKLAEERDGWKELALRSTNLAESIQEVTRGRAMMP